MFFETSLTIPKNTTELNPVTDIVKIAKGIVTEVFVFIPDGHAGLSHSYVLHHEAPIFPSTKGMNFKGNRTTYHWKEYYECYQPPFEFKVCGWNEDDTYEHTVYFAFVILPRKAVLVTAIIDALKNFFSLLSPIRIFTEGDENE